MARSTATAAAAVVLAILLIASPHVADAITCSQAVSAISPCIAYARSGVGAPSATCCAGVRSLNALAKTTPDRQTACNCLKKLAGSVKGVKPGAVTGIPSKCRVSVPFPISTSTDCSKIR
ncbi:non-specific lipid-transfer protein 1-like [Typha angustifolia]|uniref:non-specific lipid-transfer protein 1-like n=1 Tax=Typha angustifolia TaxID=59011 RepID=UPI003C2C7C95